ncbi:MAG: hypothetical protein LAO51_06670 [Acidobacteriia bacterium]|nr:hypothetical protein [Terriglobia bacterium]
MSHSATRKTLTWAACFTLALAAGLFTSLAHAADESISYDTRGEITDLLQKKIGSLLDQKNADGVGVARGSFSPNLKKVDDTTITASFLKNTADKDTEKVERLLLTFKKGANGKWAIAKEDVQDTYDGLHRSLRENDEFYRFEKFSFDRYGMKVSATNGSLFKTSYMGKPSTFTLVADDLAYDYSPPKNLNYYQTYNVVMLKEHKENYVFKPEKAEVRGDGASCEQILASAFTGLKKVAKGETSSALQKDYDDLRNEWDKSLKDNGFFGFRRPYEADRQTLDLAIKRASGEERWIWIDYDNYEPWDVQYGASAPGFGGQVFPYAIFGYYSDSVLKSTPAAADLERREDADARDFDLDSLEGTVEIGLEDSQALSGDLTYGMTIKETLRELPFNISRLRRPGDEQKETRNPKMIIKSITDGDGDELSWVKTGAYSALVIFPKPVAAGTKAVLKMQFTNLDSIYQVNPSYSAMDRGGWLPFVRFTDPIEKFDLTVKVRDKYRVLGVGKKVSEKTENGVNVTRWSSDRPVSFPTVIFGEYITDGPKIKATKKDGTEIPVHVYVDKVSTHTLDETSLKSEDDAEDRVAKFEGGARGIRGKQLSAIADQAVNALNLYREVWGQDYKFAKLDLVADPLGEFYGQSPASMIYLGFGVFRGEGEVAANMGGGSSLSKFNKDVVAHETGHQWWGSLIGNANNRNYWFIESLAEYSAALYVENVYSRKAYDEKVAEWRRGVLRYEMLSSVQDASALWGGENPGAAYQFNVYFKGPYAFHVLRETFGDEKFFKYLKDLGAELAEKQIVTMDLQRVAEKDFGGTMAWFFDEWFRSAGLPQYALFYDVRQTEDGKWLIEGKIKQRVVEGKEKTELPGVYYKSRGWLTFEFDGGKAIKYPAKAKSAGEPERMFIVDGAETPFKVKLPEKPIAVYFNKDGEILAHDTLVNQSW